MKCMVNVGKNANPMDGMGYDLILISSFIWCTVIVNMQPIAAYSGQFYLKIQSSQVVGINMESYPEFSQVSKR